MKKTKIREDIYFIRFVLGVIRPNRSMSLLW